MMRPPFLCDSAPPGFEFPRTSAPAPTSSSVASASSGQFNGGGVRGWEGPAPVLGLPVGGFDVPNEVLGTPVSLNGATIHQPWINPCLQGGSPMFSPASGISLGPSVRPQVQTDQSQALQNSIHPSPQSQNHPQGGHTTSPAVGTPISRPIGHLNPQNHHPYSNPPPGQYVQPFEAQTTQHTGLQQKWPSTNPSCQISNGVPVGMPCSNPTPAPRHWLPTNPANNVVNGVPAANFYGNPSCRPNGTQRQHPLPDSPSQVFVGAPAGNFRGNLPCRPVGPQQPYPFSNTAHQSMPAPNSVANPPRRPSEVRQQCPFPDTGNHVFNATNDVFNGGAAGNSYSNPPSKPNGSQHQSSLPEKANCVTSGIPAANFESNFNCRRSGVQQQFPLPVGNIRGSSPCKPIGEQQPVTNNANSMFNGLPAGNFQTSASCRPSTFSLNSSNSGLPGPHMGQVGPQQRVYHAVDSTNPISVNNRCNAPEPSGYVGPSLKAQPNGQIMEPVDKGTPIQQHDQHNNSWGRGRGDMRYRSPPIRNPAAWQGGRTMQANAAHMGRGGGWKERVASGDYRQRNSFRCEPCDRSFSNRHKMEAHKVAHVKCTENGCNYEAAGKLVTEHMLMMHSKKPASSANPHRLALSKDAEEEIRRWREERRKNFPIPSNIQRKAQEALARKIRGELVDEDACRRKERLREILAKQAELGVPVAEVPAHYISDTIHDAKNTGTMRRGSRNGKRAASELSMPNSDLDSTDKIRPDKIAYGGECSRSNKNASFECNVSPSRVDPAISATKMIDSAAKATLNSLPTCDNDLKQDVEAEDGKLQMPRKLCHYFRRGHCRKGRRCPFLHEKAQKKQLTEVGHPAESATPRRQPTLLAKLLDGDIRKEKSHLLQCFRFFVNNKFLDEFPEVPLKFFSWGDVEIPSDVKESLAAFKSPESSFSDVDSEGRVQSETSMLDEPNLQSFLDKGAAIPEIDMLLDDVIESETEVGTSDTDTLWAELKHQIMDDAKVGEMAVRSSYSLAV